MTKTTTLKAITFATAIALATSFGSTAFAHDLNKASENTSAVTNHASVSKSNARNLVKSLLKREYSGEGYKTNTAQKIGDKWVVSIKDRTKTVATASVDTKSGNIHIQ